MNRHRAPTQQERVVRWSKAWQTSMWCRRTQSCAPAATISEPPTAGWPPSPRVEENAEKGASAVAEPAHSPAANFCVWPTCDRRGATSQNDDWPNRLKRSAEGGDVRGERAVVGRQPALHNSFMKPHILAIGADEVGAAEPVQPAHHKFSVTRSHTSPARPPRIALAE